MPFIFLLGKDILIGLIFISLTFSTIVSFFGLIQGMVILSKDLIS